MTTPGCCYSSVGPASPPGVGIFCAVGAAQQPVSPCHRTAAAHDCHYYRPHPWRHLRLASWPLRIHPCPAAGSPPQEKSELPPYLEYIIYPLYIHTPVNLDPRHRTKGGTNEDDELLFSPKLLACVWSCVCVCWVTFCVWQTVVW
jgi:hypothetical protein